MLPSIKTPNSLILRAVSTQPLDCWLYFGLTVVQRLWGFWLSLLLDFPGLRCRLIISLAFYFAFLFTGEVDLCTSTHTSTISVSLGHLLRGRRQIVLQSCRLSFSRAARQILAYSTGWLCMVFSPFPRLCEQGEQSFPTVGIVLLCSHFRDSLFVCYGPDFVE